VPSTATEECQWKWEGQVQIGKNQMKPFYRWMDELFFGKFNIL
jgi:hypothetical protein